MSEPTPDIYEEDLMLAQAAKLDLVLARDLHARALAAEDVDDVCNLVRAYTRVSRSMRQNMGMLAKQKADRAKAEREARVDKVMLRFEDDPRDAAVDERLEALNDAIPRIAQAASGGDRDRYAGYIHRFDREMEDWHEEPDFLDFDLDAVVRHTARVLDLPSHLADRWQDLPPATMFADPAEADEDSPSRRLNWPPGSYAKDGVPEDAAASDQSADPDVPISDSA
jgi:hypothetical protein